MSGAIILTLNPHDRIGLATTIERLINLLDDLGPDADLEPSLGFVGHGTGHRTGEGVDEREDDGDDREPNGDEGDYSDADCDAGLLIGGGNEEMPRNHPRT